MAILRVVILLLLVFTPMMFEAEAAETFRWCTISTHEEAKCANMTRAFAAQNLSPNIACHAGDSITDCYNDIMNGLADLITLDGGDVYTAGKEYGLVPIIQEVYEKETYNGIAVVRASASDLTISGLGGKKSCHTGMRRTAGWNIPVGFLLENGIMPAVDCGDDANAVANFFNQSCAPGAFTVNNDPYGTNPASLCGICTDPQCPPDSTELYQSYAGALRCLAAGAGDVAFIKPATLDENLDGAGMDDWNRHLTSAEFRLLCPDDTQTTVDNWQNCNLAKAAAHAVVTSPNLAEADINSIQTMLGQAVDLFGPDDNPYGFALFDSAGYEGGRDLIFKDSTRSLLDLTANQQTYRDYLGSYALTIDGLKKCPENTLRFCTTSVEETMKCRDMKAAFTTAGITPAISCYEESNKDFCIDRIAAGDADIVTLDGGELYTAGREKKVQPVVGESYDTTGTDDVASYWAVAVARAGTNFGIDDLAGRKSCHTGIGKTSGWNVPVGHLIKQGHITVDSGCDVPKAVGQYFSGGSCAPGAKSSSYDPQGTNPASLCALCIGQGTDNCVRNAAEPYYDYSGAFRCLVEDAGHVAFVKHTTVPDNTDGSGGLDWNANLLSANYELLCPDNTRRPVANWRDCNLAKVPSHAVVTALDKTDAQRQQIFDVLNRGQELFGSDDNTVFKMFDSSDYGGSDLLFKDSTQRLVDVGTQDTYEEWLGPEYTSDLEALYCETGGAPALAFSWLLLAACLAQALWAGE